jgi:hypothetical protein
MLYVIQSRKSDLRDFLRCFLFLTGQAKKHELNWNADLHILDFGMWIWDLKIQQRNFGPGEIYFKFHGVKLRISIGRISVVG